MNRTSSLIRLLLASTLSVAASLGLTACSSDMTKQVGGNSTGAGEVGSVGVALQLGSGQVVNTASYTITGPGGFTKSGTIDVSQSNTLSAVIPGIPAG